MPKAEVAKVTKSVPYNCPCGGNGAAGYMKEFGSEQDVPFVTHSIPHCDAFLEMDYVEFLRYVRGAN